MRLIELDINDKSEEQIHAFLKEEMCFPEHYGANLDALYDMLTELSENVCVKLHRCVSEDSPVYEFGRKLEQVMEDAAQTVQLTEEGDIFAIFCATEFLDAGPRW